MKVKIKKWHAVATWRWDMPEDEVCGICRVQFDGTCPTCKFPGDDCALLMGKCGHSFHMHCVVSWIQQDSSKGLCPMCRQSKSNYTARGMGVQWLTMVKSLNGRTVSRHLGSVDDWAVSRVLRNFGILFIRLLKRQHHLIR